MLREATEAPLVLGTACFLARAVATVVNLEDFAALEAEAAARSPPPLLPAPAAVVVHAAEEEPPEPKEEEGETEVGCCGTLAFAAAEVVVAVVGMGLLRGENREALERVRELRKFGFGVTAEADLFGGIVVDAAAGALPLLGLDCWLVFTLMALTTSASPDPRFRAAIEARALAREADRSSSLGFPPNEVGTAVASGIASFSP